MARTAAKPVEVDNELASLRAESALLWRVAHAAPSIAWKIRERYFMVEREIAERTHQPLGNFPPCAAHVQRQIPQDTPRHAFHRYEAAGAITPMGEVLLFHDDSPVEVD